MEKVTQVSTPPMGNPIPPVQPTQPKQQDFMSKIKSNSKLMYGLIGIIVVLLGVGTGKVLASTTNKSSSTAQAPEVQKSGDETGLADVDESQVDEQSPEGVLKEGGSANGEGTFHLERPGGAAQNVYLTSTVLNLADFVGKKVKIWGQTSSSKSGWLMDVVKIKEIQ